MQVTFSIWAASLICWFSVPSSVCGLPTWKCVPLVVFGSSHQQGLLTKATAIDEFSACPYSLFNARELKLSSMDFTNFVVQESVNLVGYRPQVVHSIDESFDGIIFQGLEHYLFLVIFMVALFKILCC